MKASDIILYFDNIRPNSYDDSVKLNWVKDLEANVVKFAANHTLEQADLSFMSLSDFNLFLPEEYRELYVYYLVSMSDMINAEYRLYAVSSSYFNELYERWKRTYRSENVPVVNNHIKA